jgi:hypothetical protein
MCYSAGWTLSQSRKYFVSVRSFKIVNFMLDQTLYTLHIYPVMLIEQLAWQCVSEECRIFTHGSERMYVMRFWTLFIVLPARHFVRKRNPTVKRKQFFSNKSISIHNYVHFSVVLIINGVAGIAQSVLWWATGWAAGFRFPAGWRGFSLFHSVQTGSYVLGTRGSSSRSEVNNSDAIPSLPHTSSWRSAYLLN